MASAFLNNSNCTNGIRVIFVRAKLQQIIGISHRGYLHSIHMMLTMLQFLNENG